jgi:hypothetical protein
MKWTDQDLYLLAVRQENDRFGVARSDDCLNQSWTTFSNHFSRRITSPFK